jgi:hypothetical protein
VGQPIFMAVENSMIGLFFSFINSPQFFLQIKQYLIKQIIKEILQIYLQRQLLIQGSGDCLKELVRYR